MACSRRLRRGCPARCKDRGQQAGELRLQRLNALGFRVFTSPTAGRLYQYNPEGPDDPLDDAGAVLSDPEGRLIFVPAPDEFGVPDATFSVVANNGEHDSAPCIATVMIVPSPRLEYGAFGLNAGGQFELNFAGLDGTTFSVHASTTLTNWHYAVQKAETGQPEVHTPQRHAATHSPHRVQPGSRSPDQPTPSVLAPRSKPSTSVPTTSK